MDDTVYEERKTPAGFLVKVRLSKLTYVVFTDSGPEVPKGARNNSIVVNVPRVGFFGDDFDVSHFHLGELSFVNVKAGKLVIPYQHGFSNEIKTIYLGTGSLSDVLPVVIYHYKNKEDLMAAWERGEQAQFLVVDEEIPRSDMVSFKIRYPSMNILVIKKRINTSAESQSPKKDESKDKGVVDYDKVRATDVAKNQNLNTYSENPVFLARIHLRAMELDKVKQLLLDFHLSSDDVMFIRTFLDVMIKNELKKPELDIVKPQLIAMNEAFRLAVLILEFRVEDFEKELDSGFSKEISHMIYALLAKEQETAQDLEHEIVLWEWKLRVRSQIIKK
ncbi:hypothetical protein CLV96_3001 [Leptospira meyeri]|uniref:Uncharacterized protein n=1 Tax=Leptospira meyeri TaxID=29508 RepID=A0A4R8MMA9_LEPME|nr:hypothetical protein [Leptospira meyeri]EKJ85847.1 hypothetical protein LEP1GSC017_0237 [Leptospira meyeri serovar Hardjo str. Went 5]TDY68487.1 hypothetical protein CLV96_3001 [Leptospira meyeri]